MHSFDAAAYVNRKDPSYWLLCVCVWETRGGGFEMESSDMSEFVFHLNLLLLNCFCLKTLHHIVWCTATDLIHTVKCFGSKTAPREKGALGAAYYNCYLIYMFIIIILRWLQHYPSSRWHPRWLPVWPEEPTQETLRQYHCARSQGTEVGAYPLPGCHSLVVRSTITGL